MLSTLHPGSASSPATKTSRKGTRDDGFSCAATSGLSRQVPPIWLCLDLLRGTQDPTDIDASSTSRIGPSLRWEAIADLIARTTSQTDAFSQSSSDIDTDTSLYGYSMGICMGSVRDLEGVCEGSVWDL